MPFGQWSWVSGAPGAACGRWGWLTSGSTSGELGSVKERDGAREGGEWAKIGQEGEGGRMLERQKREDRDREKQGDVWGQERSGLGQPTGEPHLFWRKKDG